MGDVISNYPLRDQCCRSIEVKATPSFLTLCEPRLGKFPLFPFQKIPVKQEQEEIFPSHIKIIIPFHVIGDHALSTWSQVELITRSLLEEGTTLELRTFLPLSYPRSKLESFPRQFA